MVIPYYGQMSEGATPPQHRADALFALPNLPTRVALLGDPGGWRSDLSERLIEIADDPAGADVVVADTDHLARALATGAPNVIVDGTRKASRALERGGFAVMRLLPVPVAGPPLMLLNLASRRAARYGIEHALSHPERWRAVRNRVAARLVGAGLRPPVGELLSVATRSPGDPALLKVARDLGVPPGADWAMLVSPGSAVRRNAFLVFPRGQSRPGLVVKFGRMRGLDEHFAREERGASVLSATGGTASARAPEYRGRAERDGFWISVETAASGTKLSSFLRAPAPRARRLVPLEAVADWLVRVARETAGRAGDLEPERARLARDVLPDWETLGIPADLIGAVARVPGSLQHNDLAEENVIVDGAGFTVLDWEWAKAHGLPLGDLVYFGVHVLRLLDGALSEPDRERHFVALLRGEAASSPILFAWIRRLVGALELPPESVGAAVTLSLLDRGSLSARQRLSAEASTGAPLEAAFGERMARLWLSVPGLGPAWDAWRRVS